MNNSSLPIRSKLAEVFLVFLRLGCTSFGGPTAHLGYFEQEFVQRRKWLSAETFAELVAISQSLPGPGSSQTGYAIGVLRAGLPGGIAAWLGFTMPSAILMVTFAYSHNLFRNSYGVSILHALQLVAVAVVASAVLNMQRTLAPDIKRLCFAAVAAVIVFLLPAYFSTIVVVAVSAIAGAFLLQRTTTPHHAIAFANKKLALSALTLFIILCLICTFIPSNHPSLSSIFVGFFQAGSLVFGGGHVVLPLLQQLTVARGWISSDTFFSGYGAAQALPGPLFAFAAYLGAMIQTYPNPLISGLVALLAIFTPGLLLMTAVLPFWSQLRSYPSISAALQGVNAAVVGLLFAAFCRFVWMESVHSLTAVLAVLAIFSVLTFTRIPIWIVVAVTALIAIAGNVLR